MPFNLITERWLPVVPIGGGERRWLRPAELATAGDVEFAWGRADLNIATYELLIGLLSVAFPPKDDDDWREKLDTPPSVANLDAAFAPLVPWFNLDGDGPRFMQDYEKKFEGKIWQLESLFVDGPGENTKDNGVDLFVKSNSIEALSLPAAAIAIYAWQSYVPSVKGGKKEQHNSGLRNGGPLVTLIKLETAQLWSHLWVNAALSPGRPNPTEQPASLFPWCNVTTTSEAGQTYEVGGGHPSQCYFAMPRRVRLVFAHKQVECPITHRYVDCCVTSFETRPSGFNYGESWVHPLTPYRRNDKGTLPVKTPGRRVGYNQWCGLIYGEQRYNDKGHGRSPAGCVTAFRSRNRTRSKKATIWAVGFVTDKAKVVDFLEAEFPLILAADKDAQQELESLAHRLVTAADLVAGGLRGAVRGTLGADANKTILEGPAESLWAETEQPFRAALARIAALEHADIDALDTAVKAECEAWIPVLRAAALEAFDRTVPPETLINKRPSEQKTMIEERRRLVMMFAGKALRESLGLAPVQPKTKGKRSEREVA